MLDNKILNQVKFIENIEQRRNRYKTVVQDLDLIRLCKIKTSRAHSLLPFVEEIMSYKSEDMPDFQKLIHLLHKILLDQNITSNVRRNPFIEEMKSQNRNIRMKSTLKINFDFENMSDASMDSHEFENIDEIGSQYNHFKLNLHENQNQTDLNLN